MSDLKKYWNKYIKKLLIRLKRLQGTPYSIAAGFACGVAVSFTPFLGFHMILAALTALIVRGNIIASAIGTLIGNPWTFPFIWIAVLYTGHFLLGHTGISANVDFLHIFHAAGEAVYNLDWSKFTHDVWPIFYPMLIGSIPFYIASWIFSYMIIKKTMDRITLRQQKKLQGTKN